MPDSQQDKPINFNTFLGILTAGKGVLINGARREHVATHWNLALLNFLQQHEGAATAPNPLPLVNPLNANARDHDVVDIAVVEATRAALVNQRLIRSYSPEHNAV